MEEKARRDLTISGLMAGQGGTYHTVNLHGVGTVRGDLDCIQFHCHGQVRVEGNVHAERFAEVHGMTRISGDLATSRLNVHGRTVIGGHVSGEELAIHGLINVGGNCEAESFRSRGGFRVEGLLNAETVDVELYARCEAKEIGGGSIRVKKSATSSRFGQWLLAMLPQLGGLVAETIEGDDIELEDTRAKVVRGTNVTIGPGCRIDLVEYKGEYQQDPGATVRELRLV